MEEVLAIRVIIEETFEVKKDNSLTRMVSFSGECKCDNFNGIILNGGVDTQQIRNGHPMTLSARYILKGVDKEGQPCSIFIENNGTISGEDLKTKPYILTDSKCLSFLNGANLEGIIENWEKGVIIHIYVS